MSFSQKIMLENASSFKERGEIKALTESESRTLDSSLLSELFKDATNKAHVDFEDIPQTKGHIIKYKGYANMQSSLDILQQIADTSNKKIPEISTVKQAVMNINACADLFDKGFRYDKDFIKLVYNTLVLSCVIATSGLIESYIEYVKRPDQIEFAIKNPQSSPCEQTIANLDSYNQAMKSGEFRRGIMEMIKSDNKNFVGGLVSGGLALGLVISIVPITRELIYTVYYTRMKVSDYLNQQILLVEANKSRVELRSDLTIKKKNEILKKQEATVKKLMRISDAIKVDYAVASNKANNEIKNNNKQFTFDKLKDTSINGGSSDAGFTLI